jgi:hypothetical protein
LNVMWCAILHPLRHAASARLMRGAAAGGLARQTPGLYSHGRRY